MTRRLVSTVLALALALLAGLAPAARATISVPSSSRIVAVSLSSSRLRTAHYPTGAVPLPGIPTGCGASVISSSQLDAACTYGANNDGMTLDISTDGNNWPFRTTLDYPTAAYSATSLLHGTPYLFRATAFNRYDASASTAPFGATTTPGGSPPATPTGLAIVPDGTNPTTQLNGSYNNVTGETRFIVWKSYDNVDANFTEFKSLDADVLSFTQGALLPNSTRWYKVQAENADGRSALSAAVSGETDGTGTAAQIVAQGWEGSEWVSGAVAPSTVDADPEIKIRGGCFWTGYGAAPWNVYNSFTISTTYKHAGSKSMRLEARETDTNVVDSTSSNCATTRNGSPVSSSNKGHQRLQLSIGEAFIDSVLGNLDHGTEYRLGWFFAIPSDEGNFSGWGTFSKIIHQQHYEEGGDGGPYIQTNLGRAQGISYIIEDQIRYCQTAPCHTSSETTVSPVPHIASAITTSTAAAQHWHAVYMEVKKSYVSGYLRAWYDGAKYIDYTGPLGGVDHPAAHIDIGIYSLTAAGGVAVVYVDDLNLGDVNATCAELTPGVTCAP